MKVCGNLLSMNKLYLNPSKTEIVKFQLTGNPIFHPSLNQIISDNSLVTTSTTKFLGINLTHNLNWEIHINKLVNQLNSSIYALRCLSAFASQDVLRLAYFGLIESRLTYGIIFWGFCNVQDFKRVFSLQKSALRIMWGLGQRDSCRENFRQMVF